MNHLKDMSRKLPEFTIGGTVFTVDARIYEFREKEAPWNKISMDDFLEDAPTNILFDKQAKKIYEGSISGADRPAHVEMTKIPPIIELDPVGLARHYNLEDDVFKKTIVVKRTIPYREGLEQNSRKHKKGRRVK
jgi:hypothetical protein